MMQFKRKILAAVMTVTLVSAAVAAYATGNRDVGPAERMSYIFTQLNLTDSQQADVLGLLTTLSAEQRSQMQAQREAMRDADIPPTRDERAALRDSHRAGQSQILTDRLNTVLAPDVTADLVTYLDAHRGAMMKGGQHGGAETGRGKRRGNDQGDGQDSNGN
ncbi:Spy/CpxP family protein refolding chaperone [Reinekea sp.]|uniref:Spy/CpxP family protein refolding chaperone n=1 Tax=Reinekea sp. TaxID=1970455 RepID=UPI002A823904|nr:Spy/CpxP family protein refolding chaperone [Reinekea sp.]